ncbi:MAG: hypothetical protein J2O48_01185 [Solirubrobacterales bacterium]|nr:hypothetical protein [Solirubrobacterales bacterium]
MQLKRTVALGVAIAGLAPAAALAAGLPKAPTALTGSGAKTAIRPANITWTGDGTGVLAGATIRQPIHWSSWTAKQALGSGDDQLNNCNPACANGKYKAYPVKLVLTRPLRSHGQLVFTRLTRTYTRAIPKGYKRTTTWTASYVRAQGHSPATFGWNYVG